MFCTTLLKKFVLLV